MNQDMVFWAVIICVAGSVVVLFGMFYIIARQANKSAEKNAGLTDMPGGQANKNSGKNTG